MTDDFSGWIGRSEMVSDMIEPARSNALQIMLGNRLAARGEALPQLHHWLYFWDVKPPEGLGEDGHPARGGFLPPVRLPRRMWAGGRLQFLQPLIVGEAIERRSTIIDVTAKSGKSGDLVFVTVRHELSGRHGVAIVEEQDIVYRGAAAPGSMAAPTAGEQVPAAQWQREVNPDTVLLFRYSALTMNGHRIHYDKPYAAGVESYPGLVVQGPLQATLLMDLAVKKLGAPVSSFEFRGQAPAFDGVPLHVCGESMADGAQLWTQQGRAKCMVATASN